MSIEENEALPPANEAHEHVWELAWKHPEQGRAAWRCQHCTQMQWSDRGSVSVGPVAPWVDSNHVQTR